MFRLCLDLIGNIKVFEVESGFKVVATARWHSGQISIRDPGIWWDEIGTDITTQVSASSVLLRAFAISAFYQFEAALHIWL